MAVQSTVTVAVPPSIPDVNSTAGPASVVDVDTETTLGAVDDTENVIPAYVTADAADDGNVNNASNGTVTDASPVRRPSPPVAAAMASSTACCTTAGGFGGGPVSPTHVGPVHRKTAMLSNHVRNPASFGAHSSSLPGDSNSRIKLLRLANGVGIGPDRLLSKRNRNWRFVRLPRVLGIDPLNSFCERASTVRLDTFPSQDGIGPLN